MELTNFKTDALYSVHQPSTKCTLATVKTLILHVSVATAENATAPVEASTDCEQYLTHQNSECRLVTCVNSFVKS